MEFVASRQILERYRTLDFLEMYISILKSEISLIDIKWKMGGCSPTYKNLTTKMEKLKLLSMFFKYEI